MGDCDVVKIMEYSGCLLVIIILHKLTFNVTLQMSSQALLIKYDAGKILG